MTSHVLHFSGLSEHERQSSASMPKIGKGDRVELRVRPGAKDERTLPLPPGAALMVEAVVSQTRRLPRWPRTPRTLSSTMAYRPPVAVFDACVLYPFHTRKLLVQCAVDRLVDARWTDRIHDEWMRNLAANTPGLSAGRLEQTRDRMKASYLRQMSRVTRRA